MLSVAKYSSVFERNGRYQCLSIGRNSMSLWRSIAVSLRGMVGTNV